MQNIKEIRKKRNMTQIDLAQRLNVAQATVSRWETGEMLPDIETLQRMADLFEMSLDALMGNSAPSKGVLIPVLGNVQAGIPVEAVEEILDYEEITQNMADQGEYFALKVRGDSMEPKISNGDVVIVRKQDDVDSGDVAVILVNGNDATIKRIKKDTAGIMLIPNNPGYDPRFYSNTDIRDLPVDVIGKVVELRAKF